MPVIPLKNGIPVLGLGTWRMGGRAEHDPDNDDARDIAAIRRALDAGVHHIDTAELYAGGHSERLVAKAMAGIPREKIFLASKAFATNLKYGDVIKACEDSLARLDTDYLDIYYVHARNKNIPLEETARAFNALLRDGRIKNIGVCNFNVASMKEFQKFLDVPIAANQSHYSLVYREPERDGLVDYCRTVGATFISWRPLLWRHPERPDPPPGDAWDRGVFPVLDQIADRYGKPNVQVALNWLINQPDVCTLVKTSQEKHLQEALGCLDWTLAAEDIEMLRKNFPVQRDVSCSVPLQ